MISPSTVRAQTEAEAKLLYAIPDLANVTEILDGLRENFDGSGIPRGLMAEQIPILCRILRLADEYDQMILPKASAAMTHEEVMRFLTQRAGKQFDPRIIEVLSQLSPEYRAIHESPLSIDDEYGALRDDVFKGDFVDVVN